MISKRAQFGTLAAFGLALALSAGCDAPKSGGNSPAPPAASTTPAPVTTPPKEEAKGISHSNAATDTARGAAPTKTK